MATKKKIISADTLEKDNKKTTKKSASNLDLEKVQDFVSENKHLIGKIATIAGGLFASKKTAKTSKTKSKSKKTTKVSSEDSGLFDIFGSLFKK